MIIEINKSKLELDIGEELLMKQIKKIYPIFKKLETKELDELGITIDIIKAFFLNIDGKTSIQDLEEFIDNLNLENFQILSEKVGEILNNMNKKKETKKSSTTTPEKQ